MSTTNVIPTDQAPRFPLTSIPDDGLNHIFKFLDDKDLEQVAGVFKPFR